MRCQEKLLIWLYFYVSRLNQCQTLFATCSLVLTSILNSLFCFLTRSLKSVLFLTFSISFQLIALFINLYNAFPPLLTFFCAYLVFCVLYSKYGFSHCEWLNSNTRSIFCNLKFFITKHILFFIKTFRHQFCNIANRNIVKVSNSIW